MVSAALRWQRRTDAGLKPCVYVAELGENESYWIEPWDRDSLWCVSYFGPGGHYEPAIDLCATVTDAKAAAQKHADV